MPEKVLNLNLEALYQITEKSIKTCSNNLTYWILGIL